jgi:Sec-independent protein translocase protein TatA
MMRLIPFLAIVIIAVAVFVFASKTDMATTIRADVRKRMSEAREGMQDVADELEVDTETATV